MFTIKYFQYLLICLALVVLAGCGGINTLDYSTLDKTGEILVKRKAEPPQTPTRGSLVVQARGGPAMLAPGFHPKDPFIPIPGRTTEERKNNAIHKLIEVDERGGILLLDFEDSLRSLLVHHLGQHYAEPQVLASTQTAPEDVVFVDVQIWVPNRGYWPEATVVLTASKSDKTLFKVEATVEKNAVGAYMFGGGTTGKMLGTISAAIDQAVIKFVNESLIRNLSS